MKLRIPLFDLRGSIAILILVVGTSATALITGWQPTAAAEANATTTTQPGKKNISLASTWKYTAPKLVFAVTIDASVSTDKDDYSPGQVAFITGSGFQAGEPVILQIVYADSGFKNDPVSSFTEHSGHDPWIVLADGSGNISSSWLVEMDSFGRTLLLTADGQSSGRHAEHIFTDAVGKDFKQCSNNNGSSGLGRCDWINGIIQQSNSRYFEGMSTLQRLVLDAIPATGTNDHTLVFHDDFTKGGKHAYDFLTSWPQAVQAATDAGVPYLDVSGGTLNQARTCGDAISATAQAICNAVFPTANFIDVVVPDDAYISHDGPVQTRINGYEAKYGNRAIRIYGNAPFTSASFVSNVHDVANNADTSDSIITYTLTWKSTSTNVMLLWGEHIALGTDGPQPNVGWGAGKGASSISGGPYHVSLDGIDGTSLGSVDNQLKGADVLPPPPAGSITIVKDSIPDDPQSFNFTSGGTPAPSPAAFTLNDDAGGVDGVPHTQPFANLPAGTYNFGETLGTSGWDLTNISCTSAGGSTSSPNVGAGTVSVTLASNDAVTCVFTNTKRGHIIVDKVTQPSGDTTPFSFDATGGTSPAYTDFNLTDAQAPNNQELKPGNYSVSETTPSGWDLISSPCTSSIGDTETIGALELDPGETITCTFTNRKRGTITIVKNTSGGNGTFGFTHDVGSNSNPTVTSPFNITTVSNTGQQQFLSVVPGTYTVTEGADPSGWIFNNASCTTGGSVVGKVATIVLPAGGNITCTYNNTKLGTITIVKNTTGGDGTFGYTHNVASNSNPTVTSPFNITTVSNTGQQQFLNVVPGTYTVTEGADPAGWTFNNANCTTGGSVVGKVSTIVLPAGGNITCTYNNTKLATITIIKNTTGGDGTFGFTHNVGSNSNPTVASPFNIVTSGNTGQQQFLNVAPGTYTVTEGADPAGWVFNNASCTTGGSVVGKVSTIVLPAGGSVTCTYNNTKLGTITIVKNTAGGNGTFAFTHNVAGNSNPTVTTPFNITTVSNTGQQQFLNVVPGTYTVTEGADPSGWIFNNASCTTGGSVVGKVSTIVLPAGGNITCTYNNTKLGTITIVKNTAGGNGTFGFTHDVGSNSNPTVTSPFNITTVTNTGQQQFLNVVPGTYTVTEGADLAGWVFNNASCSTGGSVVGKVSTIVLPAGGNITCTYNNTKLGTITIVKNTTGGDGTFGYTHNVAGNSNPTVASPFNIVTSGNTGQQQFLNVVPGTYSVTEGADPAGWTFNNASCTTGGSTVGKVSTIVLPAGGSITCTYNNTKLATITIVKNTAGGNGTFAFTHNVGSNSNPTVTTPFNITTVANTGQQQFLNVVPGTYTVTEGADPSGWMFNNASCTTGGSVVGKVSTIVLPAGGSVTCTYNNTKLGTITIVKNTSGGDGTFGFTHNVAGNSNPTVASPFNIVTAGNTGQQQFLNVVPGTYTVTEGADPAGWMFNNASCSTGGSVVGKVSTIVLPAGGSITCTYNNTKLGTITIVKNTTGGDGTFGFTHNVAGNSNPSVTSPFNITTVSNTGQQQFLNVAPGTYTVTEGADPAGWSFNSASCTTGGSTVGKVSTIVLPAGGNITCTYNNTKLGTITIVKNTSGGNGTFGFTHNVAGNSNPTVASPFNITTVANTGQQQFLNVAPGTYTVTEGGDPAGWIFNNASCTTGGSVVGKVSTIVLPAGGSITCTYNNTKLGTITVVKNTTGGDGTFGYTHNVGANSSPTVTSPFNIATSSGTGQQQFLNVLPGTYTVTEGADPAGWEFNSASCTTGGSTVGKVSTIVLAPGGSVTCTYANSKLPTLTITKIITGESQTFDFVIDGMATDPVDVQITPLADGQASNGPSVISVGAHNVMEVNIPGNWMLNGVDCVSDQGGFVPTIVPPNAAFTANYGDDITCTFVNNQQGGTTRTQGFWATHTQLTNTFWNGGTLPPGTTGQNVNWVPVIQTRDAYLCNPPAPGEVYPFVTGIPITAIPLTGQNQVLGGFWSNISNRTANPKKRTELDQARMQFLQQYLAAVLNVHAFGTPLPGGITLQDARDVYCSAIPNAKLIGNMKSILAGYNEAGDNGVFTPGANATAQLSRSQANIPFWDITFR